MSDEKELSLSVDEALAIEDEARAVISVLANEVQVLRAAGVVRDLADRVDRVGELERELDGLANEVRQLREDAAVAAGQLSVARHLRDARGAVIERLQAQREAVLALHRQVIDASWPAPGHCRECWNGVDDDYVPWPCATVRALGGTEVGS